MISLIELTSLVVCAGVTVSTMLMQRRFGRRADDRGKPPADVDGGPDRPWLAPYRARGEVPADLAGECDASQAGCACTACETTPSPTLFIRTRRDGSDDFVYHRCACGARWYMERRK